MSKSTTPEYVSDCCGNCIYFRLTRPQLFEGWCEFQMSMRGEYQDICSINNYESRTPIKKGESDE